MPLGSAVPAALLGLLALVDSLTAAPLVIAHRGASGERPEHTLSAYRLALEQGADYIEPDLRSTKDRVLIALHDGSLNRTTDVASRPEFAARAQLNKKGERHWVPGDFSLEEIRSLSTRQAATGEMRDVEGTEKIPTLKEIVTLLRDWNRQHKTRAGLMPELRGDAEMFVEFVRENHLDAPDAPPVYLQSFEANTLKKVREHLKFPAALLLSQAPPPEKLLELRASFEALAVRKDQCLQPNSATWIDAANANGLQVFAWTFHDERFDKLRFRSSEEEMLHAFKNGVAGIFTDFPASGVRAKHAFVPSTR